MPLKAKTAIITFLGNAYHDSRVVNLIDSLSKLNVDVKTISFDWKTANFKTINGKTSVYKLDKSKSSLLYYFNFIFLLVKNLLRFRADIYFAEDIYTLPFVYFFAKLNKGKIYYNSREIYAHLAGLRNKGIVQKTISKIESVFIRKVDLVLVTGDMDASYLREAYKIDNFFVLRNLPKFQKEFLPFDLKKKLNIPFEEKIIIYQGVLLEGRGLLKIINILDKIPNTHFVIVGDGEFRKHFENEASKQNCKNRIHFLGSVNHTELLNYTAAADLGLALIENISISYYYALPNKLFEYIMAGVPILSSNLPQMMKIIDDFHVGSYVDPENESALVESVNSMINDESQLKQFKGNCVTAARELNWDVEFKKFEEFHLN